ncbi:MAG: 4Fe-4S binding protein [Methanomicrobiales archaeon]|jgi:NAD-dependent dihydropyrimidine dehydrogenase PreA subunit|nr:4Fe-4S binding protein [Methanomicrobiales archaeon]
MKLLVTFSRRDVKQPLIAQTVKDTGVLINVERAHVESKGGELLIDIPDKDTKIITDAMEKAGARVKQIEASVIRDETECVNCGACISVCPQDVLFFDETWTLCVDTSKCVLCGKCVDACPHQALSLLP